MAKLNRREFLRNSTAAAVFASTPGLAYSQIIGGGAPFTDYKALVCVFLFGGNDSFNMLVPRSNAEYNVYAQSRQNLAIPLDDGQIREAIGRVAAGLTTTSPSAHPIRRSRSSCSTTAVS